MMETHKYSDDVHYNACVFFFTRTVFYTKFSKENYDASTAIFFYVSTKIFVSSLLKLFHPQEILHNKLSLERFGDFERKCCVFSFPY
jgi:hypothetical protein